MGSERTMKRFLAATVAGVALASAAACDGLASLVGGDCAGVGYWAVEVTIRDPSGRPQALGATVTLQDGTYQEVHQLRPGDWGDSLTVEAAEERGGRTYDIQVTKPYYNDVSIRGVRAPGGGCVTGHESSPTHITVPVVLSLVANAPAVRSVFLMPPHVLLDRPPYQSSFKFTTFVDANPGTSHGVTWKLTGDTASVAFDAVSGALTYRCLPKSGSLTITATSVADPTLSANGDVAVQGHPGGGSDPPC
jgi:hypothetical protein